MRRISDLVVVYLPGDGGKMMIKGASQDLLAIAQDSQRDLARIVPAANKMNGAFQRRKRRGAILTRILPATPSINKVRKKIAKHLPVMTPATIIVVRSPSVARGSQGGQHPNSQRRQRGSAKMLHIAIIGGGAVEPFMDDYYVHRAIRQLPHILEDGLLCRIW